MNMTDNTPTTDPVDGFWEVRDSKTGVRDIVLVEQEEVFVHGGNHARPLDAYKYVRYLGTYDLTPTENKTALPSSSCSSCLFFVPYNSAPHGMDACRRHAPVVLATRRGSPRTQLPLVEPTFWCGDYQEGNVSLEPKPAPESEPYPEHAKLRAVSDHSQKIGEFIEWLRSEGGIVLCERDPDNPGKHTSPYWPTSRSIEGLLAEFFDIKLDTLEDEKRAMLEDLRKNHE